MLNFIFRCHLAKIINVDAVVSVWRMHPKMATPADAKLARKENIVTKVCCYATIFDTDTFIVIYLSLKLIVLLLFSPPFAVVQPCRKEQVREYYTENDCRSRQPLKYSKCVGGCGNQCCAPTRVRSRKVRMVCSNNTRYVKNLEIVRKCGCSKKCY